MDFKAPLHHISHLSYKTKHPNVHYAQAGFSVSSPVKIHELIFHPVLSHTDEWRQNNFEPKLPNFLMILPHSMKPKSTGFLEPGC